MRFKTIDGLRGIAAMAVVVFHLNSATRASFGDWLPPSLDALLRQGHFGVDIFFVISGFVIAYSIRTAAPTLAYAGRFALRRSIRLDPPYWTAIFAEIGVQALALHWAFSTVPLPSLPQFFSHFVYMQNVLGLGDIVDIFWTLCFEIQFYLALVACMIARHRLDQRLGVQRAEWISAIALGVLFLYSIGIRFNLAGLTGHPGIATIRWYQFFMGTCVWWVVSKRIPWPTLPVMWLCVVGAVTATGASLLELLPIAISGLIWWSYERDGMNALLSNAVVQWLGVISYSLYVFHATIGWRFIRLLGLLAGDSPPAFVPYLAFAAGIVVCLATSWAAWRFLESPAMRFSKRIELPKVTS